MSSRRWWHRMAGFVITKLLALYLKTLRIQVFGKERTQHELSTSAKGFVFLFWHDSILLSPLIEWATTIQPFCVLISNSRDGDIATEIGKQYPNVNVVRVKHMSRAAALLTSCELLESRQSLFITPDGPRGPRHQIKPGALFACQKSKAAIIPVVWTSSRLITLGSWDRFRIPLPFSRIFFSFLEPVTCPAEGELDMVKREIEQKMEREEERLRSK